jgi:hypothetical protein
MLIALLATLSEFQGKLDEEDEDPLKGFCSSFTLTFILVPTSLFTVIVKEN